MNSDLPIIYDDPDIWVIDKPSGLLSVPGRLPENKDSVITRLMKKAVDGEAHAVHRLDMSTSGLMVVAKNKSSLRNLHRQFAERTVYKRYNAFVDGIIDADRLSCDAPLICDWPNRPKQKVCREGKPALTHVVIEKRFESRDCTAVKLIPITGRSHQLRVHLATLGHPILGCEFYGTQDTASRADRLLLHANKLGFLSPSSNSYLLFSSNQQLFNDITEL